MAALLLLFSLLLAACQSGSSGRLLPKEQAGVTLSREAIEKDAASFEAGALKVRVFGFWDSEGGQDLFVTYRNDGPADITVALADFTLASRDAKAALAHIVQIRGFTAAGTAELDPKAAPLFPAASGSPTSLTVPAGQVRTLSVNFARFQPEAARPARGATVYAGIPAASSTVRIAFDCS